jgi:hypothetical protein
MGLVLDALQAGYNVPKTPKSTEPPSAINISSVVTIPEVEDTAPAARLKAPPNPAFTAGSSTPDRAGAATTQMATPTTPAIRLSITPSSMNWLMMFKLLKPIALSVPISFVLSRTVYNITNKTIRLVAATAITIS